MQFNVINDCDELLHAIDLIIGTLDSFVGYFEHVGFQLQTKHNERILCDKYNGDMI